MTDEQINIAIAESLGYMDIYRCGSSGKRTEQGLLHGKMLCGTLDQPSINYGREYVFIKRYTADLNACHEFEKKLSLKDRNVYTSWLYESSLNLGLATWESAHATARHRCEAYLKAIGKWEDTDHA